MRSMGSLLVSPSTELSCKYVVSNQWFSNCGTRTTNGTQKLFRWYSSHLHYFYTKAWIHSFLVLYLLDFVFKLIKACDFVVSYYCNLHARQQRKIMRHKQNYDFCKKQIIQKMQFTLVKVFNLPCLTHKRKRDRRTQNMVSS